ncbi:tRNA pseudouridine38-40 synthase [Pelagirhabdus alkalitolerans]|uniref:tRNA pseudouridine synthase A n=1 Tax=Pelagirhabdus alkalitolerans TaxID=1612202 RepID=A0A1G6M5H7_9BACI|nr:tRNA pseudouridine(38-40) synthase TruA [Pelagirhabdus alkalitolerans]SDC50574.1 tRNA pseudouridine38-40 synthase [Pelagirhabdus alkalitolerans]
MRLLATVTYDGTYYAGYQIQPNQTTIQSTIEKALMKLHKGETIRIYASGRTDAGVHALGQTFHFDSSLSIPLENWTRALNSLLPADIVVTNVREVGDHFHARYNVKQKTYQYMIDNAPIPDPFQRHYMHHVKHELDLNAMKEACSYLEGEHDFSAFCAANHTVKGSKVREIYLAHIEKEGHTIRFTVSGSGFLYNMVRIIVGTLMAIGEGKMPPETMQKIIASKDRSNAGKTAAPQGLYLKEVEYHTFD